MTNTNKIITKTYSGANTRTLLPNVADTAGVGGDKNATTLLFKINDFYKGWRKYIEWSVVNPDTGEKFWSDLVSTPDGYQYVVPQNITTLSEGRTVQYNLILRGTMDTELPDGEGGSIPVTLEVTEKSAPGSLFFTHAGMSVIGEYSGSDLDSTILGNLERMVTDVENDALYLPRTLKITWFGGLTKDIDLRSQQGYEVDDESDLLELSYAKVGDIARIGNGLVFMLILDDYNNPYSWWCLSRLTEFGQISGSPYDNEQLSTILTNYDYLLSYLSGEVTGLWSALDTKASQEDFDNLELAVGLLQENQGLFELRERKGEPNGYAGLDGSARVAKINLPTDVQYKDEKGAQFGYPDLDEDTKVPLYQLHDTPKSMLPPDTVYVDSTGFISTHILPDIPKYKLPVDVEYQINKDQPGGYIGADPMGMVGNESIHTGIGTDEILISRDQGLEWQIPHIVRDSVTGQLELRWRDELSAGGIMIGEVATVDDLPPTATNGDMFYVNTTTPSGIRGIYKYSNDGWINVMPDLDLAGYEVKSNKVHDLSDPNMDTYISTFGLNSIVEAIMAELGDKADRTEVENAITNLANIYIPLSQKNQNNGVPTINNLGTIVGSSNTKLAVSSISVSVTPNGGAIAASGSFIRMTNQVNAITPDEPTTAIFVGYACGSTTTDMTQIVVSITTGKMYVRTSVNANTWSVFKEIGGISAVDWSIITNKPDLLHIYNMNGYLNSGLQAEYSVTIPGHSGTPSSGETYLFRSLFEPTVINLGSILKVNGGPAFSIYNLVLTSNSGYSTTYSNPRLKSNFGYRMYFDGTRWVTDLYPSDWTSISGKPSSFSPNPHASTHYIDGMPDKIPLGNGTDEGLTTNDFTTSEKTKLGTVTSGAQPNVIETISLNGVNVVPSGKNIEITMPSMPTMPLSIANGGTGANNRVGAVDNLFPRNIPSGTTITKIFASDGTYATNGYGYTSLDNLRNALSIPVLPNVVQAAGTSTADIMSQNAVSTNAVGTVGITVNTTTGTLTPYNLNGGAKTGVNIPIAGTNVGLMTPTMVNQITTNRDDIATILGAQFLYFNTANSLTTVMTSTQVQTLFNTQHPTALLRQGIFYENANGSVAFRYTGSVTGWELQVQAPSIGLFENGVEGSIKGSTLVDSVSAKVDGTGKVNVYDNLPLYAVGRDDVSAPVTTSGGENQYTLTIHRKNKSNGITDFLNYNMGMATSSMAGIMRGNDKAKLDGLPTFPLSIANGGTSGTTVQTAVDALFPTSITTPTNIYTRDASNRGYTTVANLKTALAVPTVVQGTGTSTTDVMSQNAVTTQLNGKAPTNHASTSNTYGLATTSDYGHVQLTYPYGHTVPGGHTSVTRDQMAISFNTNPNTPMANDFNEIRGVGEFYYYVNPSSTANHPPFTTGGQGLYLKCMIGYSNTNIIQMCWRRNSDEVWMRTSSSASVWTSWVRMANSTDLNGKLTAVTTGSSERAYTVSSANAQTMTPIATAATADTLVKRIASGQITVPATPSATTDATSKTYVDTQVATKQTALNGTGAVVMSGTTVSYVPVETAGGSTASNIVRRSASNQIQTPTPSATTDAANKAYVDTKAPIDHAVNATTYGVATRTNYGHVRLTSPDGTGATSLMSSGSAVSYNYISGNIDLNNYRTTGEWTLDTAYTNLTNAPVTTIGNASGGYIKVYTTVGGSTVTCTQIYGRAGSKEMWIRTSSGASTWTAWEKLALGEVPNLTQPNADILPAGFLGTQVNNTALSCLANPTSKDFDDFKVAGEFYFYNTPSSVTNGPPFTSSAQGLYLKVMTGYSNTSATQMCWQRYSTEVWIRSMTGTTNVWGAWVRLARMTDVVPIVTTGSAKRAYIVDASNNQAMQTIATAATAGALVERIASGQITVPATPSATTDAASKSYVDGLHRNLIRTISFNIVTVAMGNITSPPVITNLFQSLTAGLYRVEMSYRTGTFATSGHNSVSIEGFFSTDNVSTTGDGFGLDSTIVQYQAISPNYNIAKYTGSTGIYITRDGNNGIFRQISGGLVGLGANSSRTYSLRLYKI